MVNIRKILMISGVILLSSTSQVSAHGDASVEGHDDFLNISKLGKYHYHHGHEAHLHENGICEFRKNEAIQKGSEYGFEDGYLNKTRESAYGKNHDYYKYYIESYNKSKVEGEKQLSTEIDEATLLGKEEGLKGNSKPSKSYSNPLVNEAYINSHNEGYQTYRQGEIDKKKREGYIDGKDYRNKISFENLDQDYIDAYEEGYSDGKKEYAQSIKEEGIKAAFGDSMISESYNSEEKSWFEEGFEEGKKLEETLKSEAIKDGYEGKGGEVPDKYKFAEDKYTKYYQEGVDKKAAEVKAEEELAAKKRNTTIAMITGGVLLVLVPTFIIIKKRKAKKSNDNVKDAA